MCSEAGEAPPEARRRLPLVSGQRHTGAAIPAAGGILLQGLQCL